MPNLRGASLVGRGDGVGCSYVARRSADAGRVDDAKSSRGLVVEETNQRAGNNPARERGSV